MTRRAGSAPWPRWVRGRGARALGLAMGVLVGSAYLGGYLFLWSMRLDASQATPMTLVRYVYFHAHRVGVRQRAVVCAALSAGFVSVVAVTVLWPKRRALHGDARFATGLEIARSGLLGERGIILGEWRGRCLMLDGQQGVALAAPPRTGKGVGVVIPNALNWPGSLVCVDIKKENWTVTAGYRQQQGQPCFLLDPFGEDGSTARWNPFFYVSANPQRRVNDLQRIAEMLYPDPPNVDPFWTASARSLFLGIAMYLFETPSLPKTIGEVLRQGMASDDEGFGQHWKRLVEGRNSGRFPLSSQCVRALYDVIDLAPVTASSIRKTFTSRLDLWLNPILDAATSGNDFDLRELRKTPMSIYVGVNPDDLHRLRPVLSLFFQQAIGLQTRELPERSPALKHQVMMLLDEFTALGRIPIIAEAISYLPGYNVRVVLVIQTPAQLREVYGQNGAETMLKSLGARIAFAPKDAVDAKEISEELGYTTVKVKSWSKPAADWLNPKGRRGRSVNVSEQKRALFLPQEVKELGPDTALVFCEGLRPIRCRKLRYFEDARFVGRLVPPPWCTPHGSSDAVIDRGPGEPALPAQGGVAARIDERRSAVSTPATREATLADVDRIGSLTLEDFVGDVGQIGLPLEQSVAGRASDEDMQGAVQQFLTAIRDGGRQ
ncbi:type IV secretory system conjugative DNA transfer family protein [Povalibacter sp.]|uniref:type IV secretory system conjugative DNA transfer family protein n=1 Tax=Povalibacter sp. TaxID=1962978 RepID=UPI002F425438